MVGVETDAIRATAEACRQARLYGCTIDVQVDPRWGTRVHAVITPHAELHVAPWAADDEHNEIADDQATVVIGQPTPEPTDTPPK